MYSLNVPLPGRIPALAADVAADLSAVDAGGHTGGTAYTPVAGGDTAGATSTQPSPKRVRDDAHLVAKRLTGDDEYHRLEARARDALAGAPAFEARITGVDYFAEAVSGTSPVVYLAVESPGLERLHARLSERFDPVEGVEGEEYTPHVTVARGVSMDAAERAAGPVEPVEWTVSALDVWDARRGEATARVSLPA